MRVAKSKMYWDFHHKQEYYPFAFTFVCQWNVRYLYVVVMVKDLWQDMNVERILCLDWFHIFKIRWNQTQSNFWFFFFFVICICLRRRPWEDWTKWIELSQSHKWRRFQTCWKSYCWFFLSRFESGQKWKEIFYRNFLYAIICQYKVKSRPTFSHS